MARSVVRWGKVVPPKPTEKATQHDVVKLFLAAGCVVYNLSQARASKQTAGLSDLWVVCPRRRCAWWWETKRPGAKLRSEQKTFREHCLANGVRHGFGGVPEAIEWLTRLQLVVTP